MTRLACGSLLLATMALAWNFIEFDEVVEWTILARPVNYPAHIQSLFEVPDHKACPTIKIRGTSYTKVSVEAVVSTWFKISEANFQFLGDQGLGATGIEPTPPECYGDFPKHKILFTDYSNLTVFSATILNSTAVNRTLHIASEDYTWVLVNARDTKNVSVWKKLIREKAPFLKLRSLKFRKTLEASCHMTREQIQTLKYCKERPTGEIQRHRVPFFTQSQMEKSLQVLRSASSLPNLQLSTEKPTSEEESSDVLLFCLLGAALIVTVVALFIVISKNK